jgi:hypothetical protein
LQRVQHRLAVTGVLAGAHADIEPFHRGAGADHVGFAVPAHDRAGGRDLLQEQSTGGRLGTGAGRGGRCALRGAGAKQRERDN